tara:strand:- start:1359 stop:2060 length:702 start_codon:yes stop_codon:yes gene_type:complete
MKNIILVLLSLIFTLISYSQETRKELRERSPNRLVLQLNGGVFSNYTYDIDPTSDEFINQKFRMSNVTYSGMLGYRSGFNSDKYKFSSTGRDKNWGNLFAVFYQNGMIDGVGLSDLDKKDMKIFITNLEQRVKFTELQVGVVWREFFRLSGGKGTVKVLETLDDYTDLDNVDYNVFTTGISLRFGRLTPSFNWTIMSNDSFETTMSRFDVQVGFNLYLWKKILHKDKHLISDN